MAGLVYAVTADETTLVKIGWTGAATTNRRLAALQAGSPLLLSVVWVAPGGPLAERHLHRTFADRRHHCEWFEFAGADAVALLEAAYARWVGEKLRMQELEDLRFILGSDRPWAHFDRLARAPSDAAIAVIQALGQRIEPTDFARAHAGPSGAVIPSRHAAAGVGPRRAWPCRVAMAGAHGRAFRTIT